MKVKIDSDEWHPVYGLYDDWGKNCEIDMVTYDRWVRIRKEFDDMQEEMKNCYEGRINGK